MLISMILALQRLITLCEKTSCPSLVHAISISVEWSNEIVCRFTTGALKVQAHLAVISSSPKIVLLFSDLFCSHRTFSILLIPMPSFSCGSRTFRDGLISLRWNNIVIAARKSWSPFVHLLERAFKSDWECLKQCTRLGEKQRYRCTEQRKA